ncbi:MAG: beta-lactamase family protein [Mariniblastus sp.]|nr:beta-lactamase family protein [Mariniblastus sp.]
MMMKILMPTLVFLSATSIGLVTLCGQEPDTAASGPTSEPAAEIQAAIEAFQTEHQLPGISVAISQQGKFIFNRAFGLSDLENRVPASPATVYRTASIAKPLTAICVLQLAEQGKIDLDQPISQYCPEFPAGQNPPTVRQLLCHQGGVRHYKNALEPNGTRYFSSLKDSLQLFIDDRLQAPPGTRFIYTTYGYSLLGRAVETVSGQPFDVYLQQHVFDRANMKSAGLDNVYQIIPHRTRGYAKLGEQQYQQLPAVVRDGLKPGDVVNCRLHDTSMKIPGGGLICAASDLAHLGNAMLDDQLIKRTTRDEAWTAQSTLDGKATTYGLGWVVTQADQSPRVSHSGGQAGTSTYLMILPEQQAAIAIMTNLQGAPCTRLARTLQNLIATPPSSQ